MLFTIHEIIIIFHLGHEVYYEIKYFMISELS